MILVLIHHILVVLPMEYYEKNYYVRSVMIEINKRLYLKSDNVVKNNNFDLIKQKITNIGNKLKKI